jgi:hypothetical protein
VDPITGYLVQLLIGLALSAVATLAQQAFAPKPKAQKQIPGLRGQYSTGGTVPMTIILGTYGVPGQLEYSNTWGTSGETPNAFLADVISLSDYRITDVTALWIDSKSVTLPDADLATHGYPIPEFDLNGRDHAWYRFYDGSQSAVSAYLTGKFGSDAERPWLSDMIGEGIAYAIQTARINEKLYTDFPRYMYEVEGAPVFDPRESTAAGGSGSQVWGTFSTYAFSDNPVVLIYNILRGLHDPDGNHIWGGHATEYQLPYAVWAAAMDRCDTAIDLKGGGTEPRYRAGIEISLNERPADVIRDLLVACNARPSFARGRHYILVDEPSAGAASFTDGDLLVEEPIDFSWFPNLDDAINGATATFLAPQRAWEERETRPYYRDDLEDEDGAPNREALKLRCVFSGSQAQRIIKAVVRQARKFKRHVVCLPATYRDYRPLQALEWTSDEFQYTDKLFLIISRTEDEWGRIWFALQEIDPTDFDWDEETEETELTYASTEEVAVPSQAVAGWAVEPWDDGGRRPGVHLEWTGALDDIRVTRVQIRHDGETLPFFDREYPYEDGEAVQDIYISGDPLLRDTDYEIRARFIPFDGSGRDTTWSDWLAVTTPDVGLGPEDLGDTLTAMTEYFGVRIRDLDEHMQLATSGAANQDLANYADRLYLQNKQVVGDEFISASYTEALLLALGNDGSSIADAIAAVEAASGDVQAGALTRFTAMASPGGGWARWGVMVRASVADDWPAEASFFLEAKSDGSSRIVLRAAEVNIVDDSDNILALFAAGGASFANARIVNLTATNISVKSLDADDVLVDGTLITDLIAAEAATKGTVDTGSNYVYSTSSPNTAEEEIFSTSFTPNGGTLVVLFNVRAIASAADASAFGVLTIRLKRNGSTVKTLTGIAYDEDGSTRPQDGYCFSIYGDTSPGTTSKTWSITVQGTSGDLQYSTLKDISMTFINLKK